MHQLPFRVKKVHLEMDGLVYKMCTHINTELGQPESCQLANLLLIFHDDHSFLMHTHGT